MRREDRYPIALLVTFLLIWLLFAIAPKYRDAWLLENLPVFVLLPLLVVIYRKFRLSDLSYSCIFIFLVLHMIGAQFTYAEVPFGFWIRDVLGLVRNPYDRIVHFSFGLLMVVPVREVFQRVAQTKGFWSYWFPIELVLAFSAIYEIIEWRIVGAAAPAAGIAFLGAQGDIWDAQWDMTSAALGAVVMMCVLATIHWWRQDGWHREWLESLRPKRGPIDQLSRTKK